MVATEPISRSSSDVANSHPPVEDTLRWRVDELPSYPTDAAVYLAKNDPCVPQD